MNCDIVEYVCTISLGNVGLVLALVGSGLIITLYGVIEALMEWWYGRKT